MKAEIYVRGGSALQIVMPYHPNNRSRLRDALPAGSHVKWNKSEGQWEVAFRHLDAVVNALRFFMNVKIHAFYNHSVICTASCQKAKGDDCNCSCLGVGHKGGQHLLGGIPIGDVFVLANDETEVVRKLKMYKP